MKKKAVAMRDGLEKEKQNEEIIPDFLESSNNNEINEENTQNSTDFKTSGFKLYQMKLDDLALLAKPYSNKSVETLKKLGKKRLIYIIQNKTDNEDSKNAALNNNNLERLVSTFLQACDSFRKERIGEPNNQALKSTIENNVSPAFGSGAITSVDSSLLARIIVVGGLVFIGLDSFFGVKNLLESFKIYWTKKKIQKNEGSHNAS